MVAVAPSDDGTPPPMSSEEKKQMFKKRGSSMSAQLKDGIRRMTMSSNSVRYHVKGRALVHSTWIVRTFRKKIKSVKPYAQGYIMSLPAQLFMVFLACVACLTFVASSYVENAHSFQKGIVRDDMTTLMVVLVVVDQLTNFFFLLDFVLNCIGCDNIFTYLGSILGIADCVSGIPISMIYLNSIKSSSSHQSHWSIIRTLKFLKVARISRLTRLVKLQRESHGLGHSSGNEEVKAEILNAAVILFMLVFITVDIILILEETSQQFYIGCDEELCGKNLR